MNTGKKDIISALWSLYCLLDDMEEAWNNTELIYESSDCIKWIGISELDYDKWKEMIIKACSIIQQVRE